MSAAKTSRTPGGRLLSLARWVAVGTGAAAAFGFALGLPFCLPFGSWYAPIGGLIFGLCGGPVFGLAIGWLDEAGRARGRGASWRIGMFSLAGAIVFGLTPLVISFGRMRSIDIRPGEVAEILFGLGVMAAAGAALGAIVGSMQPDRGETKTLRNGWSELEL